MQIANCDACLAGMYVHEPFKFGTRQSLVLEPRLPLHSNFDVTHLTLSIHLYDARSIGELRS